MSKLSKNDQRGIDNSPKLIKAIGAITWYWYKNPVTMEVGPMALSAEAAWEAWGATTKCRQAKVGTPSPELKTAKDISDLI